MRERALTLLRDHAAHARAEGRTALHDTEALEFAEALGFRVPARLVVGDADAVASAPLENFPGDRVVVKAVSRRLLHKTDAGGVAITAKTRLALRDTVATMAERLRGHDVEGFALHEFVPHEKSLGHELLLGCRWTEDFGPIVTLGPGGVLAEHLAAHAKEGSASAILAPTSVEATSLDTALAGTVLDALLSGRARASVPGGSREAIASLVASMLETAANCAPEPIAEFEINPLVLTESGPVALDARLILGSGPRERAAPRPLDATLALVRPETIAVVGVSERMNPGRRILKNILRAGFDPARIVVVKPGTETIDGCRCVPAIADLPFRVDMLVVAVDAAQVPELVEEVVARSAARGLLVIPGGLGERSGTEGSERRIRRVLAGARAAGAETPVVNGGNCLGIVSRPGRCDTFFLPDAKLPPPDAPPAPVAVISQSGAFAASRASRLSSLNPRYMISVGNQLDLTVGDWLTALETDREVEVFACYVEGFRPLDGARFLEASARIARSGRCVVLYGAGRTAAGAGAAASHTAAVAGDWAVLRALAARAEVVLADTLDEFDDLVRTFTGLRSRSATGMRLGAMSNAGFECVTIADRLGRFTLARWSATTEAALREILRRARLEEIVEARNPFDATPILGDEGFAEAVHAILDDPGVDVAVIGCVPMTGALETLAAGPGHAEDLTHPGSIASRLAGLAAHAKPWVAVVDAGALYDPFALHLEQAGVPTFRSADRALKALGAFCSARMGRSAGVGASGGVGRPS